ncbi:hypothetical protein D9757_001332 [Collybiopsis confluens]|uniref:Uncharacterized protein n=1 Tax=Collybiopsis confluens TaxID=2823264 RepID=A0A8H5MFY2_9AGAR|nr:hypothetical protein D9757_001332 [Collybiopsis confluens]
MEDDFTFGASVWGAEDESNSVLPPLSKTKTFEDDFISTPAPDTEFDEFNDFGTSEIASGQDIIGDDEDFGDFGDFGDAAEDIAPADFSDAAVAGPSTSRIDSDWEPLKLNPLPDRRRLQQQVDDILDPVWDDEEALEHVLSKDEIREVEGVNQILATNESRELYKNLFRAPPATKPPNWTRSRIRRQHLISLGIPVNLDEMLPPHANGKALPPLQITTRPMSAPPGPRNSSRSPAIPSSVSHSRPGSRAPSRVGSPHPGNANSSRSNQSQFGPKPVIDESKISELLELEMENLKLQPLAILERRLQEFRSQTADTSALLTFLLQTRDALQQDSETYNGLIAELVGEAQKIKSGKKTTGRRGSGM